LVSSYTDYPVNDWRACRDIRELHILIIVLGARTIRKLLGMFLSIVLRVWPCGKRLECEIIQTTKLTTTNCASYIFTVLQQLSNHLKGTFVMLGLDDVQDNYFAIIARGTSTLEECNKARGGDSKLILTPWLQI
jgi:hypothetical protein